MRKIFYMALFITLYTSCMDTICQVNVTNNSQDSINVVVHYDSAGLAKWFKNIRTANAFLTSTVPSWRTPGQYDSIELKSSFILPKGTKAVLTNEMNSKPNWVYIKDIEVERKNEKKKYSSDEFESIFKRSKDGMYVLSVND